jgi:hypothetical protein
LREWLSTVAEIPAAQVIVKPPIDKFDEFAKLFDAPKPSPNKADEFDRLFEDPPKPSPAPVPPPRQEPGEFTKFFSPSSPRVAPQPAPAPEPSRGEFTQFFGPSSNPPPPKPVAPEADEFTKMFGGPAPAAKRPPAPPSDADTGQFTRLFGSGPSGEAINIEEEQARAAKKAPPESRPFQAPTPFTRVFGPAHGAEPRPATPPRPLTVGNASGLFRNVKPPPPPKTPESAPAPMNPAESGPGEYTRLIARGSPRGPAGGANPPPAALAAGSKRGLMIGLSIGIGVLVLVIIVVIAIAMQKS